MPIFKCKVCGGDLNYAEGASVCECEYCGRRQTLPKTDSEQQLNMMNRANHFRQQCEFDKAMEIYERILPQCDGDPEVYWSIVLCRYGIEYVSDPATGRKIPTCHRTQFTSILQDADYNQALSLSDALRREVYTADAEYIDSVQKGILEISNREEPFDVFICYKESDESGKRTADSVLAQELYYQLTQEGFKVFFSRITLEDKLGSAYEPYIFAALNSARVMVVVGTKPEYFSAVWVKNEWSRYLMLMKEHKDKMLIPAYKDMDPYDLPDALSMFQAQDMSKLGFMQDLIRGIKKIAAKDEPRENVRETVVHESAGTSVEPLLKRVFMYLEDKDWKSADEYCERVLDTDPENAQAYLGKLLAEMKVSKKENLSDLMRDFSGSKNYQKAVRFGVSELAEINKQAIYNGAVSKMNNANNDNDCRAAAQIFMSLGNFSNSAEMARQCEENALNYLYAIAGRKMWDAKTNDDYIACAKIFESISGFRDAAAKAEECHVKANEARMENIYSAALSHKHNQTIPELGKAAELFDTISEWKDAAEQAEKCRQRIEDIRRVEERKRQEEKRKEEERQLAEQRMKEEAIAFEKRKKRTIAISCCSVAAIIGLIILSINVIIPETKLNNAIKMLDKGQYDEAIAAFSEMDYKNSADWVYEARYQKAMSYFNNGDYDEAVKLFSKLDYKDSLSKADEATFKILSKKKAGDIIVINHQNWIALKKENNKMLVISEAIIENRCYNYEYEVTTWENCTIREYLNEKYYNEFSNITKQHIAETENQNPDNPEYDIAGGNATKDKIFLLSIEEAETLMTESQRKASDWWWLRSRGYIGSYAARVHSEGSILSEGTSASNDGGVRPAMWLKFDE